MEQLKKQGLTFSQHTPFAACMLSISMFLAIMVFACGPREQQSRHMDKPDSLLVTTRIETFQEIGFFGEVKKEQWDGFVEAVRNNISHSRREQGNISFSLYQPADGQLQPIWFERFKSKADHNYHKEQDYFKNAISVIQRSLAGEAKSISLKEPDAIPAIPPATAKSTGSSHHVITLFEVSRGNTNAFIDAMASSAEWHRNAAGNLEFN
ncbi:MAG: antibiotic biosynthesis monooxygenase, partial [Chitinophagaceae bacterium]